MTEDAPLQPGSNEEKGMDVMEKDIQDYFDELCEGQDRQTRSAHHRVGRGLYRAGFTTVGAMCAAPVHELAKARDIGGVSLDLIVKTRKQLAGVAAG